MAIDQGITILRLHPNVHHHIKPRCEEMGKPLII